MGGNATETDSDGDGIADCNDNCDEVANGNNPGEDNQADQDSDGVGDACDNCANIKWKSKNVDKIMEPVKWQCDQGESTRKTSCIGGHWAMPVTYAPRTSTKGTNLGQWLWVAETDTDGDGVADCVDNCKMIPTTTKTQDGMASVMSVQLQVGRITTKQIAIMTATVTPATIVMISTTKTRRSGH